MSHETAAADETIALAGNQTLRLHDPRVVWTVRSGEAHVFVVALQGGEPAGARRYLATATSGDALFGMEIPEDGLVDVIVVGTPGTRLTSQDWDDWRRAASGGPDGGGRLGALDRWIAGLSAGLTGDMAPRAYRALPVPGALDLAEGDDARPESGTAWIRVLEGRIFIAGAAPLAVGPDDGVVPVAAQIWVRAAGPVRLAATATAAAVAAPDADAALRRFHRLVLEGAARQAEAEAGEDSARLGARASADAAGVEEGLLRLVSAFQPPRSTDALVREAGADADVLLSACRLVGAPMGIAMQPAPRSSLGAGRGDPLAAIARASRIRMRAVTLDGLWWARDAGPLLGFRTEGSRPVALLPTRAAGYAAADPSTGAVVPVTAAVADTIAPTAYVFYRPFPARRLGALDLLRFGVRGSGLDLATILTMGVLGGLFALAAPIVTALLVDRAIPAIDRGLLAQLTLALVAGALGAFAFQVTRSIAELRVVGKVDAAVQAAVWDRLLSLPVPFYRGYSSGDLAVRALGIDSIRQALTGAVLSSLLAALFSALSYALLFIYAPGLALVVTATLVVALGVTALGGLLQLNNERRLGAVRGRIAGMVFQFLIGISKLRVAAAERRAFGVWARAFGEQSGLVRRTQMVALAVGTFEAVFPVAVLIVVFAAVASLRGTLSTGAFLAFNAALGQVIAAVVALSAAVTASLEVVPLYERARPILHELPEVDPTKADPGELAGDVEVNAVTFRYSAGGPAVLDAVSLNAKAGQFIALVGPSGSGKSTLLRLLLGFEQPEAGSIHYDGQDLAGLDVRAVRRQLGVVLQSGKLMPGDIYTNIVGANRLTVDDAWEAARLAGFEDDVRAMPMGMYTYIMEGGGAISGGQRQRLLIARAIVTRPRILLFDEATSALDNQTQAAVSRSLEGLRATRIVIAHRLSTIVRADRIYVMDRGRIVQHGTYEELMAQPGLFADLAKRQLVS